MKSFCSIILQRLHNHQLINELYYRNPLKAVKATATHLINPYGLFSAGYPVVNDPLYNHDVFGPSKGKGGDIGGKTDEQLVRDLINIHNAENWLGIDGDSELSMFNTKSIGSDLEDSLSGTNKGKYKQRRP